MRARLSHTRDILVLLVVILVVWEVLVRLLHVREFILPAPSMVFQDFFAAPMLYGKETAVTLWVTLAGFFIAVVLGVGCAIAIALSPLLDRTLYTLLVAVNGVPKVALAPLFVIWLGTDSAPKIAIAALTAVFPILVDAVHGLHSIDPDMINMARAGQAGSAKTLWKIRLPNSLPNMFAGMKVGISLALVGAIVGEFVAGDSGLGHVILVAQSFLDTPRLFGALVLLGILGTVLFKAVAWAERITIPWHVSHRADRRKVEPIRLRRNLSAGGGTTH